MLPSSRRRVPIFLPPDSPYNRPMSAPAAANRIETSRAALIVYDACRRALRPADPVRRAAMRPVLEAWMRLIAACRDRRMPVIYTTRVLPRPHPTAKTFR